MNKLIMDDLGKNTQVTGVSSGTKIRNGVNTGEPCIVVYVPKKKPLSELKPNEIIPKRINGKIVDIQESVFKALSIMAPPARPRVVWAPGGSRIAKYRPALGGISVGHFAITAGSIGTGAYWQNKRVMLSNNHVLANCNDAEAGDAIYQPGTYDGGTATDTMATLCDFIEVIPEGTDETNEVDAAIAEPTLAANLSMDIADIEGFVLTSKPATVGMRVTKSGRTTSVTEGTVEAIDGAIRVQYPSFIAAFINQIILSNAGEDGAFVAGGDSGSACLEVPLYGDISSIVGICFAGSMTQSIVCPIAPVVTGLGLTFTVPVTLYGVVKKDGHEVSGARVLAFNLAPTGTMLELVGYVETDGDGAFSFPLSVYQFDNVVIFAQYTMGSTEYGGFHRIHCYQITNYAVVEISEYTPVPDGLFCQFKLPSGDFLNCDLTPDQYFSNLY
jgi:hypothetical protein